MGQDMPSDGFFRVNMSHCVSRISHYLIGHKNCNIKLLSKFQKATQNFSQQLLSFGKLSSSTEITSEYCHNWINNQQWMWTFHHQSCSIVEQGYQMLNSITSCVFDVFKCFFTIKAESLRDLLDSLRPESTFCVDVNDFPVSSAFLLWQLSSHAQSVSKLGLSRSELPKGLGDWHCFYATSKKLVKNRWSCRNFDYTFSFLSQLISSHKSVIF